jgi:hypothetical protein
VVTLLNLTAWGEGGQELIILVLLNLILGEVTSSSLRFGSNLGCVDVSFVSSREEQAYLWCGVWSPKTGSSWLTPGTGKEWHRLRPREQQPKGRKQKAWRWWSNAYLKIVENKLACSKTNVELRSEKEGM